MAPFSITSTALPNNAATPSPAKDSASSTTAPFSIASTVLLPISTAMPSPANEVPAA